MTSNNLFDYERGDLQLIDAAANDTSNIGYNKRFEMHELQTAISNLESNKAYGADEVHNGFLIHLGEEKRADLLGCINRVWRLGHFPDAWKLALVMPILKPGKDPLNPASYRPISLLSNLSKLMEQMVSNRLTFFLEENNHLSKSQYGFRSKRSTVDAILSLARSHLKFPFNDTSKIEFETTAGLKRE